MTKNRTKFRWYADSLPQVAKIGSAGCFAIDLTLPEHFPLNPPNNFPGKIKRNMVSTRTT
jgi:ubiquitin-protein ligase